MTDNLHPHWQTNDEDDAAPVADTAMPASAPVRVSITPASRLPAATVAIAICAVVGFSLVGGWRALNLNDVTGSWQAFTAQVGGAGSSSSSTTSAAALTAVEVHISATTGFQPTKVTVQPGQKITWINDQSIPHILNSQTLRDASGAYLNTPAVFPGGRVSFTVGKAEPDHEHTITSTTDQSLVGSVVVSKGTFAPVTASSSSHALPFGSLDGVNLPSGQGNVNTGSQQAALPKSSSSAPAIAAAPSTPPPAVVNVPPSTPGTVGGPQDAGVFPPQQYAGGAPTIDTYGASVIPTTPSGGVFPPSQNYAPLPPQPLESPHTGPGLWVVCAISAAVLWGCTRKYFTRVDSIGL